MTRGPRAGRSELRESAVERSFEIARHLVHEPDPERGRGIEALAGHEVPACGALPDLPDRVGRDHGRNDPELDLRERECRALVCDRDVCGRDEADASTDRMALYDGDNRCRTGVDRVEHAPERVRVCHVLVVRQLGRAAHPADVGPCAEALPLACEHDSTRLSDIDERLRELPDERRVERVARLGPRERDVEHVAVPFDPKRAHDTAV